MRRSIRITTPWISSSFSSRLQKQRHVGGWIGTTSNSRFSSRGRSSIQTTPPPLLLTGSSYLMPTLRIERRDNADSLRSKVQHALQQKATSVAGVKNMLRGKLSVDGAGHRWTVPIVLDLAALVPDGSPHYVAPTRGLLIDVIETLADFAISVVGVTNTPKELEAEAIQTLGLPSLMSKSSSSSLKVRLEDVVQMVLTKQQQDSLVVPEPKSKEEQTKPQPKDDMKIFKSQPAAPSPLASTTDKKQPVELPPRQTPSPSGDTDPIPSFVYFGTVRSGQQVAAAKGQSLIVIGNVSSGGEVLSDNDICVYGKLRGRALAGLASGTGRILATHFDPELICIGHVFTTVDNVVTEFGLRKAGGAAMVSLNATTGALEVQSID